MEMEYWQPRLFRNTFTYKGKSVKVNGWSVKIQLFGRRKTFSLGSSDRTKAAAEACHIYQTINTQGWDAVGQRRATADFQSQFAGAGATSGASVEFDTEYWKRRLIHRKYPERASPSGRQELSARIEYSGINRYFPLGTNAEVKAAAEAMRIHETVIRQGWAIANLKYRRELTLAMRWLDDPLAWTYTTIHTEKNGGQRHTRDERKSKPSDRSTAVIEPDTGLRIALASAIDSQAGFRCCATYGSVAEAEREIARQRVDFAIINYTLPDRPGAACLDELQRIRPGLAGLLYSVYEDSDELFQATPGGATGYMLKRTPSYRIFDPIIDTTGQLTRELIATRIREYFQRLVAAMPSGFSAVEMAKLTPREHEILALLAKGEVAKEIADSLGISVWTVHGHIKSVFEKLGVHTRTEAVVRFLQK